MYNVGGRIIQEGAETMADVWSWFAALDNNQKFDVFKILLEKVLLAGVVGIAGAIFAILMERYKSTLKRQEEWSKFMAPQIQSMLEDAEALYHHGVQTIRTLEQQAIRCNAWVKALCRNPARIETEDRYSGPDYLKREIVRYEGEMISPADLLDRTAPDDQARSLLHHPQFATARSKDPNGEFPNVLFLMLRLKPEERSEAMLTLALCTSVFTPLDRGPHNEYSEKVNAFVLAMMRRLPAENKVQKGAQEALFEVLESMRAILDRLPTAAVVNVGAEPPFRQLAIAHAVLQARLRTFFNVV
jgi:hypothetical protein